jgi:peptidyl-prolyl cis-trans isomerase A (cyclophilin A)
MLPRVAIETKLGRLHVELEAHRAPHSCSYFLGDVRSGVYEQCSFFRIVTEKNHVAEGRPAIEVAQGGHPWADVNIEPSIVHETTQATGLRHRRGTISLARFRPGAVYHSFFICFRDEPALDHGGLRHPDGLGFAAFGQLIEGCDVLDLLRQRAEAEEMLRNRITARIRAQLV